MKRWRLDWSQDFDAARKLARDRGDLPVVITGGETIDLGEKVIVVFHSEEQTLRLVGPEVDLTLEAVGSWTVMR